MSIFDEQVSRKPDLYPFCKEYSQAMWDGHWTAKPFTFASDKHDFLTKLTSGQKECIVRTLSAISQIEVAVKTFWAKIWDNLPHPSIQDLGIVAANIECVHNTAYEKLLDVLDINDVFEKNLELDWMQGRVKYLKKYNHKFYKNSRKQFVYSLILFTLFVENVSLFSQFYIINYFGKMDLLKQTNQQTRYTVLEEAKHAEIGTKLVNVIREEHPELFDDEMENRVISESIEAYNAESRIIDWLLETVEPDNLLSKEILKEYVKNKINKSLYGIGYKKAFDIDQSLIEKSEWFDDQSNGLIQSDFFASRPVEYAHSNQSFDPEDLF